MACANFCSDLKTRNKIAAILRHFPLKLNFNAKIISRMGQRATKAPSIHGGKQCQWTQSRQARWWLNGYHKDYIHLTHWGRVRHICISKLAIIGSENGLSPGRRQAIIWTNAGILLIEPLGTNLSEIIIEAHTFSFKKMHLKMLFGKWRPFCLSLTMLKVYISSVSDAIHYRINAFYLWMMKGFRHAFESMPPNFYHKMIIHSSI